MASEQAHRLVEVSLSKIQSARGKRTGLNLHRSLLVSSVLFKAKTAIIMAKYHMRCDYDSQASNESVEDDEEEEEEFIDPPQCQDNGQERVEKQQQSALEEDDAQIVPDVDYCPDIEDDSEQDIHGEISSEKDMDKENSPPKSQVSYHELCVDKSVGTDYVSKSSKCSKRRLTEVESAVESITSKRQCTEQDSCENTVDYSSCKQQEQPMDCSAPINKLVDSFSCGFSGLLCARNGQNERSDSAHSQDSHSTSSSSSSQGSLSDAFSTCSTHIKDSFETLSAPIMLSV